MVIGNLFNFRRSLQLQEYKKWRQTGIKLNGQIMDNASKDTVLQAAADLRLLKKMDRIFFDLESDSQFLMDRVIHDGFLDGKRTIECYRDQNNGKFTAIEKKLIDALVDAKYSLFAIQKVEADYGLYLIDVFSNIEIFLIDINLSQTAEPGQVVAARVVSLEGLMFTTGCACPFPAEYLPRLKDNFVHLFEKKKHLMTWDQMMRKYNTYFFITMKKSGIGIDLSDVVIHKMSHALQNVRRLELDDE